jgi:hypothetical protein
MVDKRRPCFKKTCSPLLSASAERTELIGRQIQPVFTVEMPGGKML